MDTAQRVILACFLCEQQNSAFLQFHRPDWNAQIQLPAAEKCKLLDPPFDITSIFPWGDHLSEGIPAASYAASFLQQPELYLRIRPGHHDQVIKKLQASNLSFREIGTSTVALPNGSKLDALLTLDQEVVVQDLHSQRVLDFLLPLVSELPQPVQAWDCCAASGGKSILLYDLLKGKVELTVSDIRKSILVNLENRFARAGIHAAHAFVADISGAERPNNAISNYSLILCDVPCTGSGTWSRTPEQLMGFKLATIADFAQRQQQIVSGAIPHLQAGGLLVYITCSVFRQENEAMLDFIKQKFHLQLLQVEFWKGHDKKADSMFAAVFKK